MRLPKKTRMCVVCKNKIHQEQMLRFCIINNKILEFKEGNRSAYICKSCEKNAFRIFLKKYNIKSEANSLKEYVKNVKS